MSIKTVGILGAGTMGTGIAQNIAEHGHTVFLLDADIALARRAIDQIGAALDRSVAKGRLDAPGAAAIRARLHAVDDLAKVAGTDLVIEAIFEDHAAKQALFRRLAPLLKPDTVVATNTSALSVDELARDVPDPARFLGMHYFSPAAVNKLVEVVRGSVTSPQVYDRALDFARATGKEPLPCRDGLGFVVNRFFCPSYNEASRLVDEGLDPAAIDRVARQTFAAPFGPLAVTNLTKVRIALHAQRNLARLGAFYEPAASLTRMGDADQAWTIADPAPPLDPAADQAIATRLRAAVFLPVLQLLDEGIAEPPAVDLGARTALRWGDPPAATMDRLGRDAVASLLAPALDRYRIAPPKSLARVGSLLGSLS